MVAGTKILGGRRKKVKQVITHTWVSLVILRVVSVPLYYFDGNRNAVIQDIMQMIRHRLKDHVQSPVSIHRRIRAKCERVGYVTECKKR